MDSFKYELEEQGSREYNHNDFSELHSELLFYLEDKVLYGTATNEELITYESYKVFNQIDIDSDVCKNLIKEMQIIYESGYK